MADTTELLHGSLEALVLKTLMWGPRHGYAIARWIESMGAEVLRIEEGSLYPALYRLERRGLVEAEWGLSETRRKVKLYRLTDAGREQLGRETEQWTRFADAVSRILHAPTT